MSLCISTSSASTHRPFVASRAVQTPKSAAAWSPDGQQLAYLRFRESTGRVHIISVADGADHTVSDFPAARFAGIDWSPDGRTLVAAKSLQNVDGSPIGGLVPDSGSGWGTQTDHLARAMGGPQESGVLTGRPVHRIRFMQGQ